MTSRRSALAKVERIEIVPDGASAPYGTDAIGVVVNIVTRDMHGAALRIGAGDTSVDSGDPRYTQRVEAGDPSRPGHRAGRPCPGRAGRL